MIRAFLFRAYLVVFAGSVIFGFWVGFADGGGNFATGVGIALAVATFWLIVGWVCQPLFWNK